MAFITHVCQIGLCHALTVLARESKHAASIHKEPRHFQRPAGPLPALCYAFQVPLSIQLLGEIYTLARVKPTKQKHYPNFRQPPAPAIGSLIFVEVKEIVHQAHGAVGVAAADGATDANVGS